MSISRIATDFCDWLNKVNPKSQEENEVIRYGLELFLDNIIKLIVILLIGIVLGKGFETLVVLSAFCGLRLQAGGIHAKTGLGCTCCMIMVWGISIIGDVLFDIKVTFLPFLYIFSILVIVLCVPRTINIQYCCLQDRLKKKIYSILVLTLMNAIAFFNPTLKELIIFPVILEVLTLLPNNKMIIKERTDDEKQGSGGITEGICKDIS